MTTVAFFPAAKTWKQPVSGGEKNKQIMGYTYNFFSLNKGILTNPTVWADGKNITLGDIYKVIYISQFQRRNNVLFHFSEVPSPHRAREQSGWGLICSCFSKFLSHVIKSFISVLS